MATPSVTESYLKYGSSEFGAWNHAVYDYDPLEGEHKEHRHLSEGIMVYLSRGLFAANGGTWKTDKGTINPEANAAWGPVHAEAQDALFTFSEAKWTDVFYPSQSSGEKLAAAKKTLLDKLDRAKVTDQVKKNVPEGTSEERIKEIQALTPETYLAGYEKAMEPLIKKALVENVAGPQKQGRRL